MIVVTTPTGQIGSRVVRDLLHAGEPLRVVARDPGRLPDDVRAAADVRTGRHDDPDVVGRALDGADAVFWLVPPDAGAGDAAQHYDSFTTALTANLAGCSPRVVVVSSLGRCFARPAGLLSPAWATEERIEATGVPVRALRLPFFLENLLGQAGRIADEGVLSMANAPDRPLACVATADAAARAVRLLRGAVTDGWSGQEGVPVVSDSRTPTEMAQILSEVLDRPVRLESSTVADFESMLVARGAVPGWAHDMAAMIAAQNEGVYDAEPVDAQHRGPTSFRDWCRTVLEPAVRARP